MSAISEQLRYKLHNPPHGGCNCDCHVFGKDVMHFIPCCTPERGPITISNTPPLFGGLQPNQIGTTDSAEQFHQRLLETTEEFANLMTEQNTEKKPRAPKSDGPKSFVVKADGKEYIIKLDAVRVASNADKDLALDGKLPRAKLEAAS